MSHLSSSLGLPSGSIRAGFEAAARTHQAVRDGAARPDERQVAVGVAGTPVTAAIANAANATSVDFNYLLAQAEVESALDPEARAAASSATGLYQFIDSTWLTTLKKHGGRFGLGEVAGAIGLTPAGNAYVGDPARRAEILALRNDPEVASLMAAGLAEDNRAHLMPILGRQPSHPELYLAHFLGAGGAGRFLSELQADPGQSAPALFARPAAANRAIFYAPDGSPRSLAQVMDVIGAKLDRALDRASDGAAVRYARADLAPSPFQPGYAPSPRPGAEQAGFAPRLTPGLTRASLPSAQSGRGLLPQRPPMSQVLGATFGTDPVATSPQVRRAYNTLKAFGL